jgi:hypothetical protein
MASRNCTSNIDQTDVSVGSKADLTGRAAIGAKRTSAFALRAVSGPLPECEFATARMTDSANVRVAAFAGIFWLMSALRGTTILTP